MFQKAIDPHLRQRAKIRKIIFDLSEIDPVINAAGRLLDLACLYHDHLKIPVEVRMPEDIYADLHETTPTEVKKPLPVKRTRVRGVTVIVTEPRDVTIGDWEGSGAHKGTGESVAIPKTILACEGVVQSIDGSTVTVALWIDSEEVLAEFDRSQFPPKRLEQGLVFDYVATTTAPGRTEVCIDFLTEQEATDRELDKEAEELAKRYPFDKV